MKRFLSIAFLFVSVLISAQEVIVVIDPGHGGNDPGNEAANKSLKPEKELNLIIAKKVGAYLSSKLSNVKVVYTRTDDTYPSLDARVATANSKNAVLFVSIHCNHSTKKSIKGTETHVHDLSSRKSVKLGREIEKEFKTKAGRTSRGVKTTNDREKSLQVLKFTKMTSVLVECGFMSNVNEANFLNSTNGQDLIASAIFRGIRTHLLEEYKQVKKITEGTSSSTEGSFQIQIMSSKEWMDTEKGAFKKLSKPVSRKQVAKTGYKYAYYVGEFKSKSEAQAYLDEVKKQGFKDAIIVKK
jgi:N-acetylmuramoyl-L-alanine amidase